MLCVQQVVPSEDLAIHPKILQVKATLAMILKQKTNGKTNGEWRIKPSTLNKSQHDSIILTRASAIQSLLLAVNICPLPCFDRSVSSSK